MRHVIFIFFSGGSTPPGITAPTVTSIPSPISVNGFTGLPPPQANGQPPAEAVFTNGIHPYPGIYTRLFICRISTISTVCTSSRLKRHSVAMYLYNEVVYVWLL